VEVRTVLGNGFLTIFSMTIKKVNFYQIHISINRQLNL